MELTIQACVLHGVAMHKAGVSRKRLQELIWIAQGNQEDYKVRPGYYGTNIRDWEVIGLLSKKEIGANFKITKLGRLYVTDYDKYLLQKARRDARLYSAKYTREWQKRQQLQFKMWEINKIING